MAWMPASLSATDFVFNQATVTENSGVLAVSDGAVLPLSGTVDNPARSNSIRLAT